jgi:hypothetical protein
MVPALDRLAGASPAPAHRGDEAALRNEACEGCHPAVAAEWRASLHRRAWEEPAFQRAYEREPLAFCRGCHAPEAPVAPLPSRATGALGVGCVTCHLDGDRVLAAASAPGPLRAAPHAPHLVVRDGRLDGDRACAACHEFAFPPGGAPAGPVTPMQSTVAEHRSSRAASVACATCHMARDRGHAAHDFAASRDATLTRAAVDVRARRLSETRVEVRLASRVEGHAFPTGDLFRRVEVLAEAVGPGEALLATRSRYLARHFPLAPVEPGGPRVRSIGPDDRLGAAPVALVLDLGEPARGRLVRFRVAYQRVAHPRSSDEAASALDGEIVLAEGELPVLDSSAALGTVRGSAP